MFPYVAPTIQPKHKVPPLRYYIKQISKHGQELKPLRYYIKQKSKHGQELKAKSMVEIDNYLTEANH